MPFRFLAISGSLRSTSYNTAVLHAARQLLPVDSIWRFYTALADLPPFNPDHDVTSAPAAVQHWRAALAAADAIIISSPEYAFGVPGALKNALDWAVSSGEFVDKPTAVITASSSSAGGDKANAALVQTLRVMSAKVDEQGILLIPQIGIKFSSQGELNHSATLQKLSMLLQHLEKTRVNEAV